MPRDDKVVERFKRSFRVPYQIFDILVQLIEGESRFLNACAVLRSFML